MTKDQAIALMKLIEEYGALQVQFGMELVYRREGSKHVLTAQNEAYAAVVLIAIELERLTQ